VGGARSVGRGRLCGEAATLRFGAPDGAVQEWTLRAVGERISVTGDAAALEDWVRELQQVEVPHEARD
jgi:hypothetical protein